MQSQDETVAHILDHAAAIVRAVHGIAYELDLWTQRPVSGRVTLGLRIVPMATADATPIPAEDVPATVDWFDALGSGIEHAKTDTTWSAEDATGSTSSAVSVNPDADSDSDDETATVHFLVSVGQFKVVATTAGADGPVRAESILYDIQPGAPAVGVISVGVPQA